MIRRPPRSTPKPSSAASDVYKRQELIGRESRQVYSTLRLRLDRSARNPLCENIKQFIFITDVCAKVGHDVRMLQGSKQLYFLLHLGQFLQFLPACAFSIFLSRTLECCSLLNAISLTAIIAPLSSSSPRYTRPFAPVPIRSPLRQDTCEFLESSPPPRSTWDSRGAGNSPRVKVDDWSAV